MNIKLNINEFDGPLDLLLYFIKSSEMNIMDIKIEEVTDQYIKYINLQEKLNIEISSEYLVMASELLYIKSKLLLPVEKDEQEEEIDLVEDLQNKLIEYDTYKKISNLLEEKELIRSKIYTKTPENINNLKEDIKQEKVGDINDLVKAFQMYLKRKEKQKPLNTKVTLKEISVGSRCIEIRKLLKEKTKVTFFDLFKETEKEYIVASFLAILEMAKSKELIIIQEDNFEKIYVEKVV